MAWTTACIGSALSEFGRVPGYLLGTLLSMQNRCGGWAYNELVPADADTTLRVMQFLSKIDFDGQELSRAESFVLLQKITSINIKRCVPCYTIRRAVFKAC